MQQLVSEAIDQMRIGYCWEKLAHENKAIKEHRAKRKAVHARAEKDLIGEWEPQRMENGETRPQIIARSRHIILMHKSKWNEQQKARANILFRMFPRLEQAYNIYLELVDIFNKKAIRYTSSDGQEWRATLLSYDGEEEKAEIKLESGFPFITPIAKVKPFAE